MASCSKPSEWREIIRNEALRIGFDACGFARVEEVDVDMRDSYRQWLASGKQAQMGYLDDYVELRDNPALLYPGARTMICVALNYYPVRFQSGESPRFAYYAYGRDYHDVMRDKLRQLAVFVSSYSGDTGRVCCDTAPVRERYWAVRAGLGFIGKNAQLIIPGKGSFFFLGEIVTTLEADQCISCQTIENKGDIAPFVADRMGDRVYGCDTCQQCCPWNKSARPSVHHEFAPSEEFLALDASRFETMTPDDFNRIFRHSAVKRAKYAGLKRNFEIWKKNRKSPIE